MSRTLPKDFETVMASMGWASAQRVLEALRTTEPDVAVRSNMSKGMKPLSADAVPWLPEAGAYLPERPLFAADPAWHQGLYYVQDASSMIHATAVKAVAGHFFSDVEGLRYLDACAAPGGKTTATADVLPADALVVANEADRHRANILAENVAKHGAPAVAVLRGDACRLGALGPSFHIISADVPCSGEGMMRKEPEAINQWSEGLVADCSALQRRIVENLWDALLPGGVLIYSTCTFNTAENEQNVLHFIDTFGAESVDLGLDAFEGVDGSVVPGVYAYRLGPGLVRGEGQFIAAIRKPANGSCSARPRKSPKKKGAAPAAIPREISEFMKAHLEDATSYKAVCAPDGCTYQAWPKIHAEFLETLTPMGALRCGLPLGVLKGKDIVPTHELAMSTALRTDSFPHLPMDRDEALEYLRGESPAEIPDGLPRGFVLATYEGHPLGFMKNIGRRANNLYPAEYRLRLNLK